MSPFQLDSFLAERGMITGLTKLFCIVADPIAHVRTPEMFNDYVGKIGVDAVLVPVHVTPDKLAPVVGGLRQINNLRGIIVTIPHKIAILGLCDELHESARLMGAVNVVRREPDGRLVGANFDGSGFLSALEAAVGSIKGRSVFVAGAGGVARAIAFSVAEAGAGRLTIYNRSADKADALLDRIRQAFPHLPTGRADNRPDACEIAINATSLGLRADDPLPFGVDALPGGATVAEVVMQPIMTPLLLHAQERGLRIVTGDAMLQFQLRSWLEFIGAHSGGLDFTRRCERGEVAVAG